MMITNALMILWALLGIWCSYKIGKAKGRSIEREMKPEPVRAICPCSHSLGAHKDGGRCQAQVRRPHYTPYGSRSGHEWVPCACTKYHGPIPVTSEFFHPGYVTPGEIGS